MDDATLSLNARVGRSLPLSWWPGGAQARQGAPNAARVKAPRADTAQIDSARANAAGSTGARLAVAQGVPAQVGGARVGAIRAGTTQAGPSPIGTAMHTATTISTSHDISWPARLRHAWRRHGTALGLLAALMLALWPHWAWMARRLSDGSDEPWGILALVTALVLVVREWRSLHVPAPAALVASGALALVAALARFWAPPLVAAIVAMTSLAVWLASSRRGRPAAPLAALLLLSLPIIATLQFYLGYPLRFATALFAAPVLDVFGFDVVASGAALAYRGNLVLVDPPCAGIGMLWVGSYTAALLSYLGNATPVHTLRTGIFAATCVFAANVARNVVLFLPESQTLDWPAWSHAAVGLAAFALALAPIAWFAQRGVRIAARSPAWPPRWHRRAA